MDELELDSILHVMAKSTFKRVVIHSALSVLFKCYRSIMKLTTTTEPLIPTASVHGDNPRRGFCPIQAVPEILVLKSLK